MSDVIDHRQTVRIQYYAIATNAHSESKERESESRGFWLLVYSITFIVNNNFSSNILVRVLASQSLSIH